MVSHRRTPRQRRLHRNLTEIIWCLEAGPVRASLPGMREKAMSLLQELTEAHAVSGHEDEVRAIFVDELEKFGELSSDRNGSVFCEIGD